MIGLWLGAFWLSCGPVPLRLSPRWVRLRMPSVTTNRPLGCISRRYICHVRSPVFRSYLRYVRGSGTVRLTALSIPM